MVTNNVKLIGRLVRIDVVENESKSGKPYISATLTLRVGDNDIQTRVFSMKYKANGVDEQSSYKGIMTIYVEGNALYKSYKFMDKDAIHEKAENNETIVEDIEDCEVIKLSSYGNFKFCRFQTNTFLSKDNSIKKAVNIEFNYCNRGDKNEEYVSKNYWEVVGRVETEPVETVDKHEQPIIKFKVLVPTFNKGYEKQDGTKVEDSVRLDEIEVVSHDEDVFDYIQDNFEKGSFVSLNGEIIRKVTRIEVEQELDVDRGFGRTKEIEPQFKTDTDEYFEILGGFAYESEELEEVQEFKQELWEKALEDLEEKEEELKQSDEKPFGFGKPQTQPQARKEARKGGISPFNF